ncbi:MAG: tetratricopeptide repeat protein [Xanthobacteraceae bacterium]
MIFRPGGDNDRAIADFSDAIRLNPKRAAFYYNRGNAYGAGPDFGRRFGTTTTPTRRDARGSHERSPRSF